jgi:FkbM family methyltransferase
VTPHRVPYIFDRTIVIVPGSKTVTNLPDLEYFYGVIKDIPNCTLLDIGANKGYYALLSTVKSDLSYLSFEPHPRIFRNFLTRNLHLNQVEDRGAAYNYGFARDNYIANLWYDNSENATLQKDTVKEAEIAAAIAKNPKRAGFLRYSSVRVQMRRLDDVTRTDLVWWLPNIKAIKLDVEGAESWVIDGGMEFLTRTKALLFVEIEQRHCDRFGTTVDSVIEKLRNVGYVHFEQVRNNYLCTK